MLRAFVFVLCLPIWVFAQADSPSSGSSPSPATKPAAEKPKKSQFNTQVLESEKTEVSFSAVVKVIREVQGDTEIFFDGKSGFFSLNMSAPNAGSWQNLLVSSQKKKKPVQVQYDPDSRRLTNVMPKDP